MHGAAPREAVVPRRASARLALAVVGRQAAPGVPLPLHSCPLTVFLRQLLQLGCELVAPLVKHVHVGLENADVGPHLRWGQPGPGFSQSALQRQHGAQLRAQGWLIEGVQASQVEAQRAVQEEWRGPSTQEGCVSRAVRLVSSERWLTLHSIPRRLDQADEHRGAEQSKERCRGRGVHSRVLSTQQRGISAEPRGLSAPKDG